MTSRNSQVMTLKRVLRIIVTFDSDFYNISLIKGHPPKIIWIRTGNLTTAEIAEILCQRKVDIEHFLFKEAYKDLSCIEIG